MEDRIEKDLKQCSVAKLREKLKERGQPSGGSRSDLINCLLGQEVEWRSKRKKISNNIL